MTEQFSEEKLNRLGFFLKDDWEAVRLIIDLLFIAHLWDDLIDHDNPRSDEEINQAFSKAIGAIPVNLFYQAHQRLLGPLLHSTALLWLDSTKMERGTLDDKLNCFIARNAILGVMHYSLCLVGGEPWVKEHGAQFLKEFGPRYQTFTEFLTEFDNEAA